MKVLNKKAIASLFGAFAFAFVAVFAPVATVSADCGAGINSANAANSGISCAQGNGTPAELFGGDGSIFRTIVNVLLFIIGAISVIMLIIGGIRYTISNGDSGAVTSAKNTILYAIVGLIIAFLAFAIVNWVLGAVNPGA